MSVAYGFDEILFRYYREIPHLCYSNRAVRNLQNLCKDRLILTHKIKLTDILEYLYKKECRQELDSPYICAMKEFYERRLIPYPDLLSVKDVQKVTGFSSSAVVGWISRNILKAFQPGKGYVIPKDFFVEFLISPYYRRIKNKTPIQRESLATFENLWLVRGGEQNAGSF